MRISDERNLIKGLIRSPKGRIQLLKLFPGISRTDEGPAQSARTLSVIEELEAKIKAARDRAEQLATQMNVVATEVESAKAAYAKALTDYQGGEIPERETLRQAVARVETVEQAYQAKRQEIDTLAVQLTAAKDAETAVADEEEARALIADAHAKFEKYAALARQFAAAERDALSACYSHKAGLKKLFRNAALNAIVRAALVAIRTLGIALGKELPGVVSTDWQSSEGIDLTSERHRRELAIADYERGAARWREHNAAVEEAQEATAEREKASEKLWVPGMTI